MHLENSYSLSIASSEELKWLEIAMWTRLERKSYHETEKRCPFLVNPTFAHYHTCCKFQSDLKNFQSGWWTLQSELHNTRVYKTQNDAITTTVNNIVYTNINVINTH